LALISKPDYTYIWASGGAIVEPSDVKKQTGWIAEVPPHQWENWAQNRQDQFIAHVNQRGIPAWDALSNYEAGGLSYTQGSDGKIYKSVAASGPTTTVQDPTTDATDTYWEIAFSDAGSLTETSANALYLRQDNNGSDVDNAATFRTNIGVVAATTTVGGLVELATDAETITGTDTTRAVVPSGLLAEQKSHPAFSANRNNVNQTAVASGVATKILFTTEVYDNSAAFDTGLSRYTPLMAGIYHVTFASRLNNATNESSFTVFIYKNGTQFRSVTVIQSGAAGTQSACISELVDMNGTTDYLEFFVVQDTGTARDVLGTTLQNYASAALVVRR
jgi:hypothetical protein